MQSIAAAAAANDDDDDCHDNYGNAVGFHP